MNVAERFARALGYFSIIPIGRGIDGPPEPEDVAFLPLAGITIGLLAGMAARASTRVAPPRVGAAVALGASIVGSGALHLDGFLDTCDALFAPVESARRREILRDPRHGTFAFAGGGIALLTAYAALCEIAPPDWPAALAIGEGSARVAALIAARGARSHGGATAARAFARDPSARTIALQALSLVAIALGSKHHRAIPAMLASWAAAPVLANAIAQRFDGELGGDAYGFVITVASLSHLVAMTFANRRT